jgi:outer membrane receptor protein involved in Fe transport
MTSTKRPTPRFIHFIFPVVHKSVLWLLLIVAPGFLFAQTTITGKVTDQSGASVTGASVYIQGSSGTTTDKDGQYTLRTSLTGDKELVVSSIGYRMVTRMVSLSGGQISMDFVIETDATGLNSIVVTATNTRRTQLQMPLSITTYSEAKLEKIKYNSNADILRGVPGIAAEGGGGEVASNVFVRGLPSGGQYQFTPLQFDGMPVIATMGLTSSAPDVYFRNDIGISRLEFVRGGSATLYGAGSVAGIVNYTSKTGTDVQRTMLETEFATPQKVKFDFNTGGPLNNNQMYYNLTGTYRYDKGPIVSGFPSNGYQLRGNVRKVMDNGSFTVYAQYINDQVQFYSPYHLTSDRKLPNGWDGQPINTMETPDVTNLTVRTPNGLYQSHAGNAVMTRGGYIMADLQHDFGNDWKLSAKIRNANYKHEFNFFNTDGNGRNPLSQATFFGIVAPTGTAPVYTYANDNTIIPANALVLENIIVDRIRPLNEISGQFNISKALGKGSARQTLTLGTFLSHTNSVDYNVQLRYLSEYKDRPRLVNLRYTNAAAAPASYTTNGVVSAPGYANKDLTSRRAAIYLTDEMSFGNLNLDAGFRYEVHGGRINIEKATTAANSDGRNVAWGNGAFDRFNLSADDWALAIGASYRLQSSMSVYGNFSRGYFFPEYRGYSVKYGQGGVPLYPTEKPEHILQGEAGFKFGNDMLVATLAGYYVELKDRYAVQFVSIGGSLKETQSLQSSKSYGAEATFDYEFVKSFHFSGTVTAQKSTYTLYLDSSAAVPVDNKDKWLERQPRVMFSPALSYDNKKFFASLAADYVGKRFGNASNLVKLDEYTLLRLDLGCNFTMADKETFRISAGVFNLLDSEAVTEGNPRAGNAQTNTGDFFVGRVSLPRAFYVRLGFNF